MHVRLVSVIVAVSTVTTAWFAGGSAPSGTAGKDADTLAAISVTRITGADRYDVAVHIAQATRSRADVVYLASGSDFPDALSAGPAVVRENGALLLVPPGGLSLAVGIELASLLPKRVVVVGGPLSVPDSVIAEVHSIFGASFPVTRISGDDRYEVSRRIASLAFSAGADTAFVATGSRFPDALSAGPAASWFDSPLVLIDGGASAPDAATSAAITGLHPIWVAIAGGSTSVSPGIEASLGHIATTTRFDGADRFAVSIAVNDGFDGDFSTVYLATGANFPDALVGGVLAGTQGHPMYVVPGNCVPAGVLTRLASNGTRNVVLLGGPGSLSPAVERLTPC